MTPEQVTETLARADVERAMAAMRDAQPRVCQHIVRPPGLGFRWVIVDDPAAEVIQCAALCGWAAYAKREAL